MINKSEIMEFSREFGLRANVVEKDYVLGWLLAGIFNHPVIGSSFVFKGGTCLKKCFFETYRFSEDLDFTLSESSHLDKEFLVSCFKEIAQWVYNETGREVHHPYSDSPSEGIRIKSYCFEEVFAEKIRAMAERERPRDLYDVVHLYRHDELDPDRSLILSTLEKKCAFKQIPVPTMDTFRNRPERDELESEWENMLAHQLQELPPFNQFWQALPEVIEWLHGLVAKTIKAAIPLGRLAIDATWRPPAMAQAWHADTPIEGIRFAAANRLCVNLHYQNKYRLIEPYSLRRSEEGNILLYALRHESKEWRAYRVDRIQGAEITQTAFVPEHAVELTSAGPISTPELTRRSGGYDEFKSVIPRSSSKNQSFGPKYVIECPHCGKKFSRKKMNIRLNPHKDKHGYPCSGRNGYLVDTKY